MTHTPSHPYTHNMNKMFNKEAFDQEMEDYYYEFGEFADENIKHDFQR